MAELFLFRSGDFLLLLVFFLRRSLIFRRLFFYRLFPAAVFFEGFKVELFLFVVAVVAEVLGELTMFHFYDAGRNLVQEIAVMRDDERGTAEGLDGLLHDFSRRDVEVVRWFVEDEEIRFLEKEAQERETCLLSAGEHGDFFEDVIAAEEEHTEDVSGFLLPEIEGIAHFVQDGKLGMEALLLLRVVAHLHVIAELDDASVCRLFSRDEL